MTTEQEQGQERLINQKEFRAILSTYNITQAQAAELIATETGQKVGPRKVRTWLADPEIPSSRGCPSWALTALKRVTENLTPANIKDS
ncbi:hypothetical protein RO575_22635 [Methylomonas sp. MO1]|uniref:hypothetical protein n=1 Tax=Methylomonas sp. MO1 TaxID=3073619 RepID=UPI0028A3B519|nr:hypothetical protein [Methylomonas sp. MO1]MDT4292373.1 hypothetical protein [Methylomonas sp. MO1]